MRRAIGIIEAPRTWREVPESGVVFGAGIEAGTVLMEWRPAADPAHIEVVVRRSRYGRSRGWALALPRADFRILLLNQIREAWDPCIYPFGFPLDGPNGFNGRNGGDAS